MNAVEQRTTSDERTAGAIGASSMNERELAEIIGAFNDVTSKLHTAHESLRGEVTRLKNELREANEQVERSRRLAALGEMAAGIAHEVRNPLGSIGLYAKMLVDDLGDRPMERRIAEKIGGAVRGLDAVVGDVLAFSREMKLRAEAVDAKELIRGAVEEGLGADRARVDVVLQVQRDEIVCDPNLLHRALVNVIRNAAEAMLGDGAMRAARLVVSVEDGAMTTRDGEVKAATLVRVEDNGPGVSEDVLKRMFNPFFTTRATGTGLGLAIVHRIVDAHGGRVQVRNRLEAGGEGAGASVEIVLPQRVRQSVDGVDGLGGIRASAGEHVRGMEALA